jgi:hypothetical protein
VSKTVIAQRSDGTLALARYRSADDSKPDSIFIDSTTGPAIRIENDQQIWSRVSTRAAAKKAAVRDPANVSKPDFYYYTGTCIPVPAGTIYRPEDFDKYRTQSFVPFFSLCEAGKVELGEPAASWFQIPTGYVEFPTQEALARAGDELKKVADNSREALSKPYTVTIRRVYVDRHRKTIGFADGVVATRSDGTSAMVGPMELASKRYGETMILNPVAKRVIRIDRLSRDWFMSPWEKGVETWTNPLSEPSKTVYLGVIYNWAGCDDMGRDPESVCVPVKIERGEPAASWFEIPKDHRQMSSSYDFEVAFYSARGIEISPETAALFRKQDEQFKQLAAEQGLKP